MKMGRWSRIWLGIIIEEIIRVTIGMAIIIGEAIITTIHLHRLSAMRKHHIILCL